ncbi:ketopantoate reductase family protein [Pseudoalteromonas luteoviolacea]|uniref:ketopantoate reductase family protein n=1 Tax=Pseudoalteromonas luteoviolacea TaxID=43657 RepID=UPI0009BEB718|nr:2-dehydropantoate 2-reductase N-terminal domain-containing protein [Pseudoalteromonas luteoviolacea]
MNRIHILGRGAIGLLLANKLSSHTKSTLITRDDSVENYHFIDKDKTSVIPVNQTTFASLKAKISTCIIPVKAYQLNQALHALMPHLQDDADIILSHNGMSDIAEIAQLLKPSQGLYFLTTSMGGMKPAANAVKYTAPGLLR